MTLPTDMLQALEDDSFHDVCLVGHGGVEVPATKFMLAAQSPVFKSMFYGSFQETSSDKVTLDYHPTVLQVLVKFCFSDEVACLLFLEQDSLSDEEAILLVQLRDAAQYFQFPLLMDAINNEIGGSVSENCEYGCVCAILSELATRGENEGPMWDIMMAVIRLEPEKCLFPQMAKCSIAGSKTKKEEQEHCNMGIVQCSVYLLRKILEQIDDKFVVVRCLQNWTAYDHLPTDDKDKDSSTCQVDKEFIDFADKIDLKSIPPSQLAQLTPCPLIPMERLFDALRHHCSNIVLHSWFWNRRHKFVLVVGAGVDCVNGLYLGIEQDGKESFCKIGKYGDVESYFFVEKDKHGSNESDAWRILVKPKSSTPLLMYEAPVNQDDDTILPFSWRCREGNSPAPYATTTKLNEEMFYHFFR